ncbi:hypothetical protein CMO94_02375 [Candidatus Woesearchaeota archaeon]|nr:hypothetical protein [Candidatus Woesearchaeota archaeon]
MVLAVLIVGCTKSIEPVKNEPFIIESVSSPSSSISVKLTVEAFTEILKLGGETDLIVTISSLDGNSYDDTTAHIELPKGITLVSGDTEWIGNLENPASFNARVKFEEVGDWTITVGAKSIISEDIWLGGNAKVCFSVSEDKITMESGECQTIGSSKAEQLAEEDIPPIDIEPIESIITPDPAIPPKQIGER